MFAANKEDLLYSWYMTYSTDLAPSDYHLVSSSSVLTKISKNGSTNSFTVKEEDLLYTWYLVTRPGSLRLPFAKESVST